MSAAHLPARANLEFLKKQSKDLRKAFADGDAEARGRIRTHLPRAGSLSDAELAGLDLSLQEAQHALACHYGFDKWEALVEAVEPPRFEDLARLSDRETQILMREASQLDLVRGLKDAPDQVRERFFANMSERIRVFLQTEMDLDGQGSAEDTDAARQGILRNVLELREQGWITWPPPADRPPSTGTPSAPADPSLARVRASLGELSLDELADIVLGLAEQARKLGILSLEQHVPTGKGTLLTEGLRLAVDGTEPELVIDMLEVRGATILRSRTLRGQMAIEGWMSIHSGDNPAIVAQKLTTYFVEEPEYEVSPARDITADELAARIAETPLARMRLEQIVELYRDLAFLARRYKLSKTIPLADRVDDPVLAAGMRATDPAGGSADAVLAAMEEALHAERVALHQRHCLVIKGLAGIQSGHKPVELVAAARAWAATEAAALPRESVPRPVTPL